MQGNSSNERLGLLGIKRIDLAAHKHVSQHQILQDLNSLPASHFIIVLESLKEVNLRFRPLFLIHVHLATAFPNDAVDLWVGQSRFNIERLVVNFSLFLVVFHFAVHLNFERIDFEQDGTFGVVCATDFC